MDTGFTALFDHPNKPFITFVYTVLLLMPKRPAARMVSSFSIMQRTRALARCSRFPSNGHTSYPDLSHVYEWKGEKYANKPVGAHKRSFGTLLRVGRKSCILPAVDDIL